MIDTMNWSDTLTLLSRIYDESEEAHVGLGWPLLGRDNVGNETDDVVIDALAAYQTLGRPVPEPLMTDIMAYLHGHPHEAETWRRAIQTGLVVDDRPVAAT